MTMVLDLIDDAIRRAAEKNKKEGKSAPLMPVYLRAVMFGSAKGYQLVMGERFLGDRIAFYGNCTVGEFLTKLDHAAIIRRLLIPSIPEGADFGYVAERRDGLWFFMTKQAFDAYERWEDYRKHVVGLLVMMKMGMIE